MAHKKRYLQGSAELVVDVVRETTNLVEQTQSSVSRKVFDRLKYFSPLRPIASPIESAINATASGVYATIRRAVPEPRDAAPHNDASLNDSPAPETFTVPTAPRGRAMRLLDNAQGALNGFYGDYLRTRGNDLALDMTFRVRGKTLPLNRPALEQAFPEAGTATDSGKLCVFVHGLSCTEWSWNAGAERFYDNPDTNFGGMLREDLGFTPLFVRYNTGLHISENGRMLSDRIAEFVNCYPGKVREIVLVGHSMGGLVARSAAYYAEKESEAWLRELRHVFCIGSPNLGAPMEKATNLLSGILSKFNSAGAQVPAEILNTRSAGIKDLRYGYTIDDEWRDRDPDAVLDDQRENLPFARGVDYYYIAATVTRDPAHPMGAALGDLLVRLPSASGHAPEEPRRIPFHSGHVITGTNHLHIANHPDVYRAIKEWINAGETLEEKQC